MKRLLILMSIIAFTCVESVSAENRPIDKLFRGAINVVTAPLEVPKQARAYWIEGAYKTDHILVWIGSGAVWGIVQGIKRSGSGMWDIMSFPWNQPDQYEPLFKPDYVFEQWPSDPDVFIFKRNLK